MKPCGGLTLRSGVTIVGIVELVFVVLYFALGGYFLNLSKEPNPFNENLIEPAVKVAAAAHASFQEHCRVGGITFMVVASIKLVLSLFLLLGAYKRHRVICLVWFFFTFILVGLTLIGKVFSGRGYSGTLWALLINGLEVYFLWVVFAFAQELKQYEGNQNSQHTTS